MKKQKDIKTLEKITKFLLEAFICVAYEIENVEEIFNSNKALKVLKKYPLINASLDDLIYELFSYFEELTIMHENDKK